MPAKVSGLRSIFSRIATERNNIKIFTVPVYNDAVATVLLAEWALTTNYFDGAFLDGPVPRFFAANPTEARAALSADASKAYKDLQRIFSRLFITENIPASDAWNFVGNPR
jgi:hypothetical protein